MQYLFCEISTGPQDVRRPQWVITGNAQFESKMSAAALHAPGRPIRHLKALP